MKAFVSGGGALDQKIGEFLNSIGLPTLQGYGLTETSPVVSCNIPGKIKIETVGPPFKTNEVKIADDGEILVRGENVMLGYWNMKKETNDVIKNSWLHTGDIGEFTKDGNLKITDRKKEIIVNLGGDNISPSLAIFTSLVLKGGPTVSILISPGILQLTTGEVSVNPYPGNVGNPIEFKNSPIF